MWARSQVADDYSLVTQAARKGTRLMTGRGKHGRSVAPLSVDPRQVADVFPTTSLRGVFSRVKWKSWSHLPHRAARTKRRAEGPARSRGSLSVAIAVAGALPSFAFAFIWGIPPTPRILEGRLQGRNAVQL